jgi:6-phosphogluconolactonase
MPEIIIKTDAEELAVLAADRFVDLASIAIAERGRFTVSLSGGSTPRAAYSLLASDVYRNRVDWSNVLFFFGDERFVPPGADQSNFRMANLTLFKPLGINPQNIFRWKTELGEPKEAAKQYEQVLSENLGDGQHSFDLVLLGMGPDGHIASLFPHTKALSEHKKLAVPNWVDKLNAWRLTTTFPLINRSANIVFLVAGEEKAETLRNVLKGKKFPDTFPAQNVRPIAGKLSWLLDEAAAGTLKNKDASVHN